MIEEILFILHVVNGILIIIRNVDLVKLYVYSSIITRIIVCNTKMRIYVQLI